MLFAILIDRESLEIDVASRSKLWLHGTRDVNRTLQTHLRHAFLDHGKVDGDFTGHLDGATERYLAVALREVQVADRELPALDMHWQVYFGSAGKILDVAIPTMLWSAWNGPRSLFANFLLDVVATVAYVHGLGLGGEGDHTAHVFALTDKLGLALVPRLQHFVGGCAPENARVDEPGKFDAGDVS